MAKKLKITIGKSNLTNAIEITEGMRGKTIKDYEIQLQWIIEDNLKRKNLPSVWWKYSDKNICADLLGLAKPDLTMEKLQIYITELLDEVYRKMN